MYKFDLLQHAARQGAGALAGQAARSVRDRVWSYRHLVFRYDVARQGHPEPAPDETLACREVSDPGQLGPGALAALATTGADWGRTEWIGDPRWTLWLAERTDQPGAPAGTVWWRTAAAAGPFFCPLPAGAVLIGPIATLPEARGQGVAPRAMRSLMAHLASEGVRTFFIDCRDYNLASRTAIERAGFVPAGLCEENRRTGHRRWRPVAEAVPETLPAALPLELTPKLSRTAGA